MMNRRKMDFITGVLVTVAMIAIFFICPILWLYEKDLFCIIVFVFGFILCYIGACIWEYKPKNKVTK